MQTYPYAVTIHCQGKATIERVIAFNAYDAGLQAIMQFTSAKNIANENADDAIVMRIEPDFTMVKRPEPQPDVADHVLGTISMKTIARLALSHEKGVAAIRATAIESTAQRDSDPEPNDA